MKKEDVKIKLPELIKENPVAGAVISKLNRDNANTTVTPQNSNIQSISMSVNEKLRSNEDIVQLFPDTELCIQILTSSVISPNDMINNKLNYKAPDIRLPSTIKETILQEIENHIEKYYDLNSRLSTILREALFTKGAYVEAIIPEASLDDIISQYNSKRNVSFEHFTHTFFKPTFEFLGKDSGDYYISASMSNESMGNETIKFNISMNGFSTGTKSETFRITQEDLNLEITDNFKILNMNKFLINNVKHNTKSKLYGNVGVSTEDALELDKWFKPAGSFTYKEYIDVKTIDNASRESYGKPLVLKLPVESVVPVHVVNDPSKHLGYFVLLDNNGTPIVGNINGAENDVEYTDYINLNSDSKLNLIQKAKNGLYGMTKKDPTINNIEELYSNIIETMLKDKLKKGLLGDLVDLKDNADIYRIMLNRALRNQQTKILFLPSELVVYYAFDYRDNGTGRSLLEKSSILYSIRAILLFSRIMAYLKNSITITEVNTVIDEKDTNPDSTMEMIKSEVLKLRQATMPLGITAVNDLQEWVSMSGTRFKFQHPGLPNTEITTSDMSTSKTLPDDELDRIVKEYIIMSFGLTPEIVESGYSTDFATTVTAKNLLLAKRTTQMQNIFTPQISEHIRKLLINDNLIINKIKDIVSSNIQDIKKHLKKEDKSDESNIKLDKISKNKLIDYITDKFINEIDIILPKPETQEANNIKQAFEDYESTLNTVLDLMFSSDSFPSEFAGDISNFVDQLKSMFKTVLIKTWLSNNNYLPELSQFLTKDEDGKPSFDILTDYTSFLDSVSDAFIPFAKSRTKKVSKLNDKISKATENSSGSGGYDDYGDNNDEDDDNNDINDEGGNEDLNGDITGDEDTEGTEGGEDDMDIDTDDDFGDDFGDDDTGGNSGGGEKSADDQKLTEAKIDVEKARAEKIRAETELQKAKIKELEGETDVLGNMDNSVMDDDDDYNSDTGDIDDDTGYNIKSGKKDIPEQQTEEESKINVPKQVRPYTSDLM